MTTSTEIPVLAGSYRHRSYNQALVAAVRSADALLIVAPEYNNGIPAVIEEPQVVCVGFQRSSG
jgi:NAD(P)H-dependent FMN reductase